MMLQIDFHWTVPIWIIRNMMFRILLLSIQIHCEDCYSNFVNCLYRIHIEEFIGDVVNLQSMYILVYSILIIIVSSHIRIWMDAKIRQLYVRSSNEGLVIPAWNSSLKWCNKTGIINNCKTNIIIILNDCFVFVLPSNRNFCFILFKINRY